MVQQRPRRIHIHDVAMRDGLQIEPNFVPTEQKIALINALSRTGVSKIEATSFTSPKAIPALRDAEEVMMGIERAPGVKYVCLVPNMRGAQRAMQCGVDEINLVMSASETHNLANLRMTREQSLRVLSEITAELQGKIDINISISTAFGCPMEGIVPSEDVLRLGDRFAALGVQGITLCDTTGMANPAQVEALCTGLAQRWPLELTLHFHNTRGMGLANVIAGLATGIDRYDSSLAGLGGCPYAPGATGNICSEDLVHMLDSMGLQTGVDLDRLVFCAKQMAEMVGHDVPGQVMKAGRWDKRFPVPPDLELTRERALARDAH
ncbi:hydroxymethylglutaryl-CoA lyase [Pollutimonas nitritireducens]|uniref:Hydroxymethylglutaryl-CoA lyase n=1 Tax=Pollutimonas nitritireducens TaxID=2045209 RepID=A0A2N4UDZ2_9BURK|nr:hydroxymethylglutaryl-CoA lyase [Pollutimonas nitritireducens]PLC53234.1 hydroxymethylglutaryl-CoA lyase [Pollutimonas nitritireducens]